MHYVDEENIKKRQEALHRSQFDIAKTVIIEGLEYTFSERILLENLCSMSLPEQFIVMETEAAKLKYPSEFRPQTILTDESGEVNFSFSYISEEQASNQTIKSILEDLRMTNKRMHPANVFDNIQAIESSSLVIPYYSVRATAFDADIYAVQFIAAMNGHLLLGGFTCRYGRHAEWSLLLPQCFETLRDLSLSDDEKEEK